MDVGDVMKIIPLSLVVMLASFPAFAADLTISKKDCDIVAYQPDDGVEYKPGVDVNGKKVVPADLDSSAEPVVLPEKITIPIAVDLAEGGLTPQINGRPFGTLKNEADLGSLTFDVKTHDLMYNGKKISDGSRHAIAEACNKNFGKKK